MTNPRNRRSAGLPGVVATVLPVLMLSGCGQKGPLYLPGNPSEIKTEVPVQRDVQEMPASEQQDEDEDTEEQPE